MAHGQLYYNQIRSGGARVKTASYTAVDADAFSLIVFNSASAVTFTLPAPPTSNLWNVRVLNIGAGTVTLAAGSLTYNGSATMPTFATEVGATIYTDGSNYFGLAEGGSGGGSGVTSIDGITGAVTLKQGTNVTISDNTPSAGDIQIAASSGGGAGVPWATFTDPTTVSFSWMNQGSATVTTRTKSLYLLAPAISGDNIRGQQIAAPTAPWSVTACLVPQQFNVNYNQVGLYVSDGTKIQFFILAANGLVALNDYSNPTTYAGTQVFSANLGAPLPFLFLKIYYDGTTLYFYWSVNGVDFTLLSSVAGTSFLSSVSYVGWCADSANATYPAAVLLVSWLQGTN